MVLSAALDSGYVFLSLVAILTSVIGGVYVRPLIDITPGSLNPLSETLRDKPINLSDFEMNRGVQHVDKGSKSLNYIDFRQAEVILSHVKFNHQANHIPVKSKIVDTILQKICLKNILIHIVSFCRLETTCLMMFAKRKISDVILRTGDLLRKVISKLSFRLISLINIKGRRSFRSINGLHKLSRREGKQNLVDKFSTVVVKYGVFYTTYLRSIIVRTEGSMVKLTQDQFRFIFNKEQKRFIATLRNKKEPNIVINPTYTLNPWFLTGFTDAEGTFSISLRKSSSSRSGFIIHPLFQIGLHIKDTELLKEIQANFKGIGRISNKENSVYFRVQSLEEILNVIIPHFDKYSLITQKLADYLLFRKIVIKMKDGEHLTKEGLQAIVNIRATINLGLSEDLKAAFPNTIPEPRPLIENLKITDPEWVAGFVSGEGCFYIGLWKAIDRKYGVRIRVDFIITQHSRDELLLRSFVDYFKCGSYSKKARSGEFIVKNFSDIIAKILPFFQKYKIRGVKSLDYQDWYRVAEILQANKYLTPEVIDEIRQIKGGMNKGRK